MGEGRTIEEENSKEVKEIVSIKEHHT